MYTNTLYKCSKSYFMNGYTFQDFSFMYYNVINLKLETLLSASKDAYKSCLILEKSKN